jgi:hypothetical protein
MKGPFLLRNPGGFLCEIAHLLHFLSDRIKHEVHTV